VAVLVAVAVEQVDIENLILILPQVAFQFLLKHILLQ
jgi:hypothetical protein